MFNQLLADTQGGNSMFWILIALLGVLIIAYIFSYYRRKKYNQETSNMLNALKPGDKVKTYSGFYGTVVSIKETTDGKVVTLETGDDKHKSYTTIDSNAIYCIDKKEDIVYDADGNIVMPATDEEKEQAKIETVTEETVEQSTEAENNTEEKANVVVEEAPEDKPTKKRSSKKN